MFIDITDLYCLTTKPTTIIHRHLPNTRYPLQDMASDQRHIYDPSTFLPHAFQFKFCIFCFRLCLILFLTVAMSSSRVASSLDIVYSHERAMMALQNLLAGDGLNWCGESGLDYERLSSSDSDITTLSSSSSTAHFGLHDFTYSFCPRSFALRHG